MKSAAKSFCYIAIFFIMLLSAGAAFADAPVAENDGYSVAEGGTLNIAASGVLGNDTDADSDPLTVATPRPVSDVSHGTLTLNANGSFTYEHDGSETTSDSFTYYANDGTANSNLATVTITVTAENDVPVAENDSYSVPEGGTLNVNPASSVLDNDTDADGDSLTVATPRPVSDVSHGTLTLNANGSFTYEHDGSETTSDSFTYYANDGTANSNLATVTITVTAENDVPVAVNDGYSVAEGGTLNIAANGVLGNDTDADSDPLAVGTPRPVSNVSHGTLTLNVNGSFTYVHDGSETTSDSFTYVANDGAANSNVATVSITVTSENDAPAAVNDSYTVAEGGTLTIDASTGVLDNDTDADGDPLTVGTPRPVSNVSNGTLTLNANGSFTYIHDGGETTSDSFTYVANDGAANSNVATVSITVTSVNDAPVITGQIGLPLSTDEDVSLDLFNFSPFLAVTDSDNLYPDGFSLVIQNGDDYTHSGTTVTPISNYFGNLSVNVRVNDGSGAPNALSEPFGLSVVVDPVDDPPAVGNIPDRSIAEGGSFADVNLANYLTEVDGDTIIWSSTGSSALTVSIVNQVATVTVPDEDWYGAETITFTAKDAPDGLSDSDGVTFTVTAVNDAPEITSTPGTGANTNIEYVYNATATDVDNDDNSLVWSFAPGFNPPGMTLAPDTGSSTTITWTPGTGIDTSGQVRLRVSDGDKTTTQTFTIEVTDKPSVSISPVDQVGTTTATVIANVVAPGIPPAAQHGICWNTTGNPVIEADDKTERGSVVGITDFTTNLTGLVSGATYYVRAYAENSEGIAYSDVAEFQTHYLPAVTTQNVTQLSSNSATGNGTIVDTGNPLPTSHGICWSTGENPAIGGDCIDIGSVTAQGAFAGGMTDLTPDTVYHVRAYATNIVGTVYGDQISFTTANDAMTPRATVSDTIAPLTNATTYSLQVGGIGVVSYRYRLDNGAWSEELPVSQQLAFDIVDQGRHDLAVIGKAGSGIWQAEQNPTTVSWVVDTTPPEAELSNSPTGLVGPWAADIDVQGDDVVAFRYSLDGEPWSTIYPVSAPIALPDLPAGPHTLAVMGADRAGNWQDEEDVVEIAWEVDSSVPTALLTNLPDAVTSETSIAIGVATPAGGITVTEYYYRFEDSNRWFYGNVNEPIAVSGLLEGEYTLCVNAGDGNDNWQDGSDGASSTDSATCFNWRVDLTPANPAVLAVENRLSLFTEMTPMVDSKAVALSWTWSSDDAEEAIRRYRVWYSQSLITPETLESAVEVYCDILPGTEGFEEQLVIDGLIPGEAYYFAVTSIDAAGNASALSNVAVVTTDRMIPEIHTLEFDQEGLTTDNGAVDELQIRGAFFLGAAGGNLVRFVSDTALFELSSRPGTAKAISVDIPLGAPTGTYRIQVVNKHGISLSSADRVVIEEAETPLPAVRAVDPLLVLAGTSTALIIMGDNFSESLMGVNLIDADGTAVALSDVVWVNPNMIRATFMPDEDFSAGQYCIQVVNTEDAFNVISAPKLVVLHPLDLNATSGATSTTGSIRLEGGLVPVFTVMHSDDSVMSGVPKDNAARIKVILEPGTVFETQDAGDWMPYEGPIWQPQILASVTPDAGIGQDFIPFRLGADQMLKLGSDTSVFVVMEVSLPAYVSEPLVYQVETDGNLSVAGVSGTWQGIDMIAGGTILAERFNVPETGVTTFTLGILLDHMSDYVIGSTEDDVPLPITFGSSDEYGMCFIGAAHGAPQGLLHYLAALVVSIVGAVFLLKKRYLRVLTAFLLLIVLAGFVFTIPMARAAEGVAAAPSAETGEEGIAIPGETETEQETVDVLKGAETGYVPAAASSVRKRARRDGEERHWNIHAGLGYAFIGQEDTATYEGTEVTHKLNGDLYPILGLSYLFSNHWAMELSVRRDFYSGEISNSLSGSSSKLEGITTNLAVFYRGGSYTWSWLGEWRPYGMAGIGYRTLDGDLDYPVTSYKPAIGAVLGIGMLKGKWDFRLGSSFFRHDADSTKEGYTGSGGKLDTSGIYLEIAYHFLKF